jgi:hypothetical protein
MTNRSRVHPVMACLQDYHIITDGVPVIRNSAEPSLDPRLSSGFCGAHLHLNQDYEQIPFESAIKSRCEADECYRTVVEIGRWDARGGACVSERGPQGLSSR